MIQVKEYIKKNGMVKAHERQARADIAVDVQEQKFSDEDVAAIFLRHGIEVEAR
jgi:hypothetical protein